MPKKSAPKTYHHGALRAELLTQAVKVLDDSGVDELSLRDLAKRTHVSPAAPYRHFPTKQALVAALAEEGFSELEDTLRRAAADESLTTQVLALAGAYLDLAQRRPHLFRTMFSADLGPSRVHEGVLRSCDRVYDLLLGIFERGKSAGTFGAEEPAEQVLLFWTTLHGYAMLRIDRRLDDLGLDAEGHRALVQKLLGRVFPALARRT
jgi:AcrR family transcriptional regulator